MVAAGLLSVVAEQETVRFLAAVSIAGLFCAVLALLPNWLVTVNPLVIFDSFTWGLFFICSLPMVGAAALGRFALAFGNSLQLRAADSPLANGLDSPVPVLEDIK